MAATGVLARVLPGRRRGSWPRSSMARPFSVPRPTRSGGSRRWAGTGPEALKLSKAEARRLSLLGELAGAEAGTAALGYLHGAEAAVDAALLRAAFAGLPPDLAVLEEARRGGEARFPLTAADLMPGLTGPRWARG
jgi:poly(A) polymerase